MTRLAAAAFAVAITSGCVQKSGDCALHRTCLPCTMDGCAWCFETGECLATGTLCQGERALLPEQCEEEERILDIDAGSIGADTDLASFEASPPPP